MPGIGDIESCQSVPYTEVTAMSLSSTTIIARVYNVQADWIPIIHLNLDKAFVSKDTNQSVSI